MSYQYFVDQAAPFGSAEPWGATFCSGLGKKGATSVSGTNFALYAPDASRVIVQLYDNQGKMYPVDLHRDAAESEVWHVFVPGVFPGTRYVYRVSGPNDPARGYRFNDHKVLLDPWAKGIDGTITHSEHLFGYSWYHNSPGNKDLSFSELDSEGFMPKCVVMEPLERIRGVRVPLEEMVIYETHVELATKKFPGLQEEIQGTYAALGHPLWIAYLKRLGITTLELMPIQLGMSPGHLVDRGLEDFWNYNTLNFFIPHPYGTTTDPEALRREVAGAFAALAKEGIEVILDVVYNHTAEGNQLGPMISYRGIANNRYYHLEAGGRYYRNWSGTGNTLNLNERCVQRLFLDSLLYWIDLGVSGFRFDLTGALVRARDGSIDLRFLASLRDMPGFQGIKLIAEPWDASDGYILGWLPSPFQEWNGQFRDRIREVVKGGSVSDLVSPFFGSRQIFDARGPHASINFATCHDGFTLYDLVSYNTKHNDANGENNRDGDSDTRSWNCGFEGETDDPQVNALRRRQMRNFMLLLLLARGVPMIRGGDEVCQTFYGNNNAYCQRELNLIQWEERLSKEWVRRFQAFVAQLIHLRHREPVFNRRGFYRGDGDACWFGDIRPGHALGGLFLDGTKIGEVERYSGKPIRGASFLLLFNFYHERLGIQIPTEFSHGTNLTGSRWRVEVNTAWEAISEEVRIFVAGEVVALTARSIQLLRLV